ncbi:hypothetical protein [Streptomyces nigra]|uniref:hypothetical protein n=1 Tax=Streptomyces nigra TaxID=1827580 RepID=UPI001ABEF552|nr:hypothetical protein [Streptomyces nigra]
MAINTAHELGHKREQLERRLSRMALAQSGYGHFYVEHNHGHHVRVATPEDHASSRMARASGASPSCRHGQCALGLAPGAASAGAPRTPRRQPHNDVLTAWALTAALFAVLAVAFGPVVLPSCSFRR